jgi:hypothetical protein
MEQKSNKQIKAQMDAAAGGAQKDLANVGPEAVEKVAEWWRKWYLKAGHKRLARILMGK